MESALARKFWHQLEAIHAVAYFSPECRAGLTEAGLRGFWMGYFASRAAPLGAVSPGVVEATFFNFHPAMVRRAIPAAWALVTPEKVLAARQRAAARALQRLVPEAVGYLDRLLPTLREAIDHGQGAGRPLFAANRDLADTDGFGALWLAVTTLREHRGDGHVAVLMDADLGGCEAHVLFSAAEGCPPQVLRDNRGWSIGDWGAASEGLMDRGLLSPSGEITESGRILHVAIEQRTDELAMLPYRALSNEDADLAIRLLTELGGKVVESGEIPFPNPMGLPEPKVTADRVVPPSSRSGHPQPEP